MAQETASVPEEPHSYRYKAFISYRHNRRDEHVASRLQSAIEHFVPPHEKGEKPEKYVVFRDETELSLSSNLDASLKEALDGSEFLIVICSEETKKSKWVLSEIDHFLSAHDSRHVLTVLVSGNAEEVYPERLLEERSKEDVVIRTHSPLSANLTDESGQYHPASFHKESVRILAALADLSFDTLWQRERRYRMRRIAIVAGAAALALAVIAAISVTSAVTISNQNKSIKAKDALTSASNAQLRLKDDNYKEAYLAAKSSLESDPEGSSSALAEQVLAESCFAYSRGVATSQLVDLPAGVVIMVPTSDGSRLAILDDENNVKCIDASTGDVLWENHDLVRQLLVNDAQRSSVKKLDFEMHITSDDSVLSIAYLKFPSWSEGIDMQSGEQVWSSDLPYSPASIPGRFYDASSTADRLLYAECDEGAAQLVLHLLDARTGEELKRMETGLSLGDNGDMSDGNACKVAWDQGQSRFIVAVRDVDDEDIDAATWHVLTGTADGTLSASVEMAFSKSEDIMALAIADGDAPFLVLHGADASQSPALTALREDGTVFAERTLDGMSCIWKSYLGGGLIRILPLRDDSIAVVGLSSVAILSDGMQRYQAYDVSKQIIDACALNEDAIGLYTEDNEILWMSLLDDEDRAVFGYSDDRLTGGYVRICTLLDGADAYCGSAPKSFIAAMFLLSNRQSSADKYRGFFVGTEDRSKIYSAISIDDDGGQEVWQPDSSSYIRGVIWSGDKSQLLGFSGNSELDTGNVTIFDAETLGSKDTCPIASGMFDGMIVAPGDGEDEFICMGSTSFTHFRRNEMGTYAEVSHDSYDTFLEEPDGGIRHFEIAQRYGSDGDFDVVVYENGAEEKTIEGLVGKPWANGSFGDIFCSAGQNGWLVVGLYPEDDSVSLDSFLAIDWETGESHDIPIDIDASPSRGIAVAGSAKEFSVVTNDSQIASFDLESGEQIRSMAFPHMASSVIAAAYCNDDKTLLVLTEDSLAVCDLALGTVQSEDADFSDLSKSGFCALNIEPSVDGKRIYVLARNVGDTAGSFLVLDRNSMGIAAVVYDVLDFDAASGKLLRITSTGKDSTVMAYPIYSRDELLKKGESLWN